MKKILFVVLLIPVVCVYGQNKSGKTHTTNGTGSADCCDTLAMSLGKKKFVQNCAMCHSADIDIVGPKLGGVTGRRTNSWLVKMITDGTALKQSGDKDAVALYECWGQIAHPDSHLSEADIAAVISYLKTLK